MIHKHREHDAPERRPAWRYGSILVLAGLLAAGARSAHGEALPRGGRVVIEDQRLSVTLAEAPLPNVLVALAQAAPFKISVKGAVEAIPISLTLHNVALEDGLRRLLQHTSYAIISAPASAAPLGPRRPRIVELLVLGSGETASRRRVGGSWPNTTPAPGTASGSADATAVMPQAGEPQLAPDDLGQRVQTLRTLARRPSPEGQTILAIALDDPQEEVRATALQVLRDQSTAVPVERLTLLAREDSNAHLRLDALTLLAERAPEAAWEALEAARHDAEPGIRERAERLLDELDAFATQRTHTPDP